MAVLVSSLNLDWVFSASENTRFPSVVRFLGRVGYLMLVLALVKGPDNLFAAVAALAIEMMAVSVVIFYAARPHVSRASLALALAGVPELLKHAGKVGIGQLARQVKTNVDILMLGLLSTTAAVGYYSAAYRLVMFVNMLAGSFATVLMPRVARGHYDGGQAARPAMLGIRISAVVSAAVAALIVPVAPQALVVLFGESYAPAGRVMVVLTIGASFLFLSLTLGNVAIAVGREQPSRPRRSSRRRPTSH